MAILLINEWKIINQMSIVILRDQFMYAEGEKKYQIGSRFSEIVLQNSRSEK